MKKTSRRPPKPNNNIYTLQKEVEYAHLGLDLEDVDFANLRNPFRDYHTIEDYTKILKVIREPRNFYFTCKHILNVEPNIQQLVILEELWHRPFPMLIGSRGMSKTYILALLNMLRMLITQGCRIVIVSASFRQSKYLWDYMDTIWKNAPILRDICGDNSGSSKNADMWLYKMGDSTCKCIPLGHGETIRGLRANYIECEEFGSVSEDVFEKVISGFAASASNPIDNVKKLARLEVMKKQGTWTKEIEKKVLSSQKPNQIIISGTADWGFRHFAKYWRKYRSIVQSGGDEKKLEVALGAPPPHSFDWRDYSVIRIPIDLVTKGMMDDKNIARARSTTTAARFMMEYQACFVTDSNGFFSRSLVESCICSKPIQLPDGPIEFSYRLEGNPACEYIMACDPASESDNFSIVVLELHPNHRRLVYCWTTTREKHYNKFKQNSDNENYFYGYINNKIRTIMSRFNIKYISIDSGGGGIEVMGILHDLRRLDPGQVPIWPLRKDNPLRWPDAKDYGYDDEFGMHILEMVSMSKDSYVVFGNHGLKQDLESKTLLLPKIDAISLLTAEESDKTYAEDSHESCCMEILELYEELSTIIHTCTDSGRDRWETPTIIMADNKKARMRKDRYSSLLYANTLARRLMQTTTIQHQSVPAGGWVKQYDKQSFEGQPLYSGPEWFAKAANNSALGICVKR